MRQGSNIPAVGISDFFFFLDAYNLGVETRTVSFQTIITFVSTVCSVYRIENLAPYFLFSHWEISVESREMIIDM